MIRALIEWYRQQAVTLHVVRYEPLMSHWAGKVNCSMQQKIGSEVLDRLRTVRARTGVFWLLAVLAYVRT